MAETFKTPDVRLDTEVVASTVWPVMLRAPEAERLVVEALPSVVCPETVNRDAVVVARVEVPVTVKNPVVVELVVVRLVKEAFRADKREEKNPVELVALVMLEFVASRDDVKKLVEVADVKVGVSVSV